MITATQRDRAAQRQRTDVAHEDLCRISVVPEESETGPHHRSAKDGQLTHARQVLQVQILGKNCMAGDIGQDRQG